MIGNTASIYGSYMYPKSAGPQYIPGGSANACICLVVAALALTLRYIHLWENKKLERAETARADAEAAGVAGDGRDARPDGFRYVY